MHVYKAPFTHASELASPGVMCVHEYVLPITFRSPDAQDGVIVCEGAGMSSGKTGLLPLDSGPG